MPTPEMQQDWVCHLKGNGTGKKNAGLCSTCVTDDDVLEEVAAAGKQVSL